MTISGKAFVFGDNVNTDEIIAARYLNTADGPTLARFVMEDIRPGFGQKEGLRGGIFVAGENFGCGSSREHAPLAIRCAGIQAVLARSFARIFLRNAINIGLPIVELPAAAEFSEEDQLTIDLEAGKVINLTKDCEHVFAAYPEFLRAVVAAGGWLLFAQKLRERAPKETR
jgi:3-isopropylmalate/(R)-2-methylmalate dehydratase small subunit